ncbi:MAG: hypothetical protein ACK5FG_07120 [Chryseotalea sp.]
MKNRTPIFYSLFFVLTLVIACDEEDAPPVFQVKDFETTIEENPSNGFVIGKLEATTNKGTLTFTLTEESVPGALELDAAKAELKVKDKSKFDFETTTKLTAKVNVSNANVAKTINIVVNIKDVPEQVAPLETLISKFNPIIDASIYPIDFTIGYKFKVTETNIVVNSLGCAPATDGEYTVTLYANDTEQILATAKVKAVGTSETKVKFFYTDLSTKINLEKDKTYTVGYFQPKNQKFFLIQNTILNDQKLIPGLTILGGFYADGNSIPNTEISFMIAADIKYLPVVGVVTDHSLSHQAFTSSESPAGDSELIFILIRVPLIMKRENTILLNALPNL